VNDLGQISVPDTHVISLVH